MPADPDRPRADQDDQSGQDPAGRTDPPAGSIRVLFLGDVFGQPGRKAVRQALPVLRERWRPHLVAANAENVSGGIGVTPKEADELFGLGLDVLTSGNHVWRHRAIGPYLEQNERLIRPANYPAGAPGRGSVVIDTRSGPRVGFVNLEGRVFMSNLDNPFTVVETELAGLEGRADAVVVDFHAEATSEKMAMGWHLDGRVGAVIGTHTHVQTADARVLPGGTGFMTDIGMAGVVDSVIGVAVKPVVKRFVTLRPTPWTPAKGATAVHGAVIDLDPATGGCLGIQGFQHFL